MKLSNAGQSHTTGPGIDLGQPDYSSPVLSTGLSGRSQKQNREGGNVPDLRGLQGRGKTQTGRVLGATEVQARLDALESHAQGQAGFPQRWEKSGKASLAGS